MFNKGENMIKKRRYFTSLICSLVLCAFAIVVCSVMHIGAKIVTVNATSLSADDITNVFAVGEYKTCDDAHKIEIAEDGTAKFDDAYTLTASGSEGAYVLDGQLGTSNTSVKFVQLNNHALICVSHIKYTIDETSYIIYQNTPFLLNYTPVENADGGIEVWNNNIKSATFGDFQSAFVYASSGDIIKLTKDLTVLEGATLMGKTLTIDGGNFTLDKSSWANTVFAVADNATLNINNLTIDGKATGWEVDFDAVTFTDTKIPLKANSFSDDPVTSYSAITTSGKLTGNNLNVRNIYSTSTYGSALAISKGEVELSNSEFNHNSAKCGGALAIGFSLLEGSLEEFPVKKVTLTDTDFKNNYASNRDGGAVFIIGATEININNCEFNTNVCNDGDGGAIMIYKTGTPFKLGLLFPQIMINNSEFLNNWAGNDGFAIQNYDAEFTIFNTKFIGNVGVAFPGQSMASFSCQLERSGVFGVQRIENCLFERNKGVCSCLDDHGGLADFRVKNTTFRENDGNTTVYLLTGVASFDNCTFENEKAHRAVFQCLPNDKSSWYAGSGKTTSTIVLKDTTFTNSESVDVRLQSYNHANTTLVEGELYIEGVTTANISLRDESYLIINGRLIGNIILDEKTPSENVVFGKNSKLEGNLTTAVTQCEATINYLDENGEN